MSNQSWQETLVSAASDGTALASATTASIVPAQAKFTLPANKIWYPGQMLKVTAQGRLTTTASPGTLTFLIKAGSTTIATSQAITPQASQTNITWWLEWLLTCRAVGSAASFIHVGNITNIASGVVMIPATAPATGTTFDSTAAQQIDLQGTMSVASQSLTLHMYKLELLN